MLRRYRLKDLNIFLIILGSIAIVFTLIVIAVLNRSYLLSLLALAVTAAHLTATMPSPSRTIL